MIKTLDEIITPQSGWRRTNIHKRIKNWVSMFRKGELFGSVNMIELTRTFHELEGPIDVMYELESVLDWKWVVGTSNSEEFIIEFIDRVTSEMFLADYEYDKKQPDFVPFSAELESELKMRGLIK